MTTNRSQIVHASTSAYKTATLAAGEVLVDIAEGRLVIGDGDTEGGIGLPTPGEVAAKASTLDLASAGAGIGLVYGAASVPMTLAQAATAVFAPGTTNVFISGSVAPFDGGHGTYKLIGIAAPGGHLGYFQNGADYYELQAHEGWVSTDQFKRAGDPDDAASWNRCNAYCVVKGVTRVKLWGRNYDIRTAQVVFNFAIQLEGVGFIESGKIVGINDNLTSIGEVASGTWVICGIVGTRNIELDGPAVRGAYINKIGFAQVHPTPGSGAWTPNNYDHIFGDVSNSGGISFGDIMLFGVNKFLKSTGSGRLRMENIKGQVFTEGVYIDTEYDVVRMKDCHFWAYCTGNAKVTTYQQANQRMFRINRCDGFYVTDSFSFGGGKMYSFEDAGNGVCTDFKINKVYADGNKYGFYVDAPGVFGTVDSFTHQGENLPAGDGSSLPGSCGIYVTANGGGGYISLGWMRGERFADAMIHDVSLSCTFEIANSVYARTAPGSQLFRSGTGNVVLNHQPVSDGTTNNWGVYGSDYIITADTIPFGFQTNADGSGNVIVAHNIPGNLWYGNRGRCTAMIRDTGGNELPMKFTGIDGVNVGFSSSGTYAGLPVRGCIVVDRFTGPL